MNYASTNEANNHDNDFPVMTGDDVTDMVCKPASASASVPEWQANGFATEDEYLFMQSLGARDQEVVKLEAENARLQGDLEAAQAIIAKAGADMQVLRDEITMLRRALKPFADMADFDGWNITATGTDSVVFAANEHKLLRSDFEMAQKALKASK